MGGGTSLLAYFEGGSNQVLRATVDHPLWSLDDEGWDQAGHLDLGEQVDALLGPMRLVTAVALPITYVRRTSASTIIGI